MKSRLQTENCAGVSDVSVAPEESGERYYVNM